MAQDDGAIANQPFADSKFGPQTVTRLRAAFQASRHPMLIADDHRRWVTGNPAACDLLGIAREEVPWHTMDDFTSPSERQRLEKLWDTFLASGAAEGWYQLYVPQQGAVPVEFSVTANVLPARHLSVFMPPETTSTDPVEIPDVPFWTPADVEASRHARFTPREREVMTLVAAGWHTTELAERLFVSPETIKSHVQNAMRKLDAHTRAHAVAIALVSGQISWEEGPTA